MTRGTVSTSRAPPVAFVVLDRAPDNRLTRSMLDDLAGAVEAVEKDPGIRAAVLSGAGGTFCSGTDLGAFQGMDPKSLLAAAQLGQDLAWRIERSEKVWIAAVDGVAQGGGLDFGLACDLLIAAEDADFASPEVEEGWIPFFGGTQRLRLAVGRARAREAILTGSPIAARDGLAMGFVNRLVPRGTVHAAAEDLARTIASRPWPAVRAAKRLLVEQMDKPYRNGFLLEAQHFAQLASERRAPK